MRCPHEGPKQIVPRTRSLIRRPTAAVVAARSGSASGAIAVVWGTVCNAHGRGSAPGLVGAAFTSTQHDRMTDLIEQVITMPTGY